MWLALATLQLIIAFCVLVIPVGTVRAAEAYKITAGWIELGALRGGYTYKHPINEQDVRERVDMMAQLGMDTAIIAYVEHGGFYYPTKISFYDKGSGKTEGPGQKHLTSFDAVDTVLSQAEKNNIKVFVGLSRAGDLNLVLDILARKASAERVHDNVSIINRIADELWQRYGKHKSFQGWYITHEVSELNKSVQLVEPIVRHLKSLAPGTLVMIAPNIDNYLTAEQIRKSSVDILVYHDGVGSGYVPGKGYTYNPELSLARITNKWKEVAEMNRGTDKQIWAGLDIWEMDGKCPNAPKGYGCPYPAPWSRVLQQMEYAGKYVVKISGYSVVPFMSDPKFENPLISSYGLSTVEEKAQKLFGGYSDYLYKTRKN